MRIDRASSRVITFTRKFSVDESFDVEFSSFFFSKSNEISRKSVFVFERIWIVWKGIERDVLDDSAKAELREGELLACQVAYEIE